jgi:cytochrome c
VAVETGATYTFWEFNLRFKIDSSLNGPVKGQPVLVGQGMQGDRAQVVFSTPTEVSNYIKIKCTGE